MATIANTLTWSAVAGSAGTFVVRGDVTGDTIANFFFYVTMTDAQPLIASDFIL